MAVGYNYIRANAPPGGCQCFDLQGGFFSVGMHLSRWLGAEAEITGQHVNDISALGQDLTLLTFAAGPTIHKTFGRFDSFGQLLIGGAHGSDSYFPEGLNSSTTASSFELQAGGGIDYLLSDHFSIRIANVQYLKTQLPNGTNNEQNELMAGAGIVYRFNGFGSRREKSEPPPPSPTGQIALSCSSNVNSIDEGDTLEIIAKTLTEPSNLALTYNWSTTVGTIVGTGDRVSLDTHGIPPGGYEIIGHVTAAGPTLLSADCDIPFRIKTPAETIQSPTPAPVTAPIDVAKDREFHANVPDALFDYDSYSIRPDAQNAINHAVAYLQSHPEIGVLIGGFADDRGSAEYNLVLGQQRAEAARKALIAAGVAPERLQIISYGKEVQVCTSEDEACRQQNRRAAFSMHP